MKKGMESVTSCASSRACKKKREKNKLEGDDKSLDVVLREEPCVLDGGPDWTGAWGVLGYSASTPVDETFALMLLTSPQVLNVPRRDPNAL
jgi:hypothetical protein